MRYKLSRLLAVIAILCLVIGLGYQIHVLRNQVRDLSSEIQKLKQRPMSVMINQATPQTTPPNQSERSQSPFRLLNSETVINPAVENGMKASEREMQLRLHQRMQNRNNLPMPSTTPGSESRSRWLE